MTENYNIHRCDHCSGPKIRKEKLEKLKEKVEKKKEKLDKAIKNDKPIHPHFFMTKLEINIATGCYIETKTGRKKNKTHL